MNFDYTLQIENIDYGFVKGDGKIVFIKVGLGGSCSGYENKYLTMAQGLRTKYSCSVIVASNPNDGKDHFEADKQAIEQYVLENGIHSPRLFFFGHSNGSIKGLALTEVGVAFEKMILVNMPLMINFHKTKAYLAAIPKTEIIAVYGELDPSFRYVPFLSGKFQNLNVLKIPKADHNFAGMRTEFIDLSELLFET